MGDDGHSNEHYHNCGHGGDNYYPGNIETGRDYVRFSGLLRCCSGIRHSHSASSLVGRIIWEDCVNCQFTEDDSANANLLPFLEKRFENIYFFLSYTARGAAAAAAAAYSTAGEHTNTCYEYWAQKIARAIPSFILRAYTPLTVFHHVKLIAKLEKYRHLLTDLLKQYYPSVALDLFSKASDLLLQQGCSSNGRRSFVHSHSIGLQRVVESIRATINVGALYGAAIDNDGL